MQFDSVRVDHTSDAAGSQQHGVMSDRTGQSRVTTDKQVNRITDDADCEGCASLSFNYETTAFIV